MAKEVRVSAEPCEIGNYQHFELEVSPKELLTEYSRLMAKADEIIEAADTLHSDIIKTMYGKHWDILDPGEGAELTTYTKEDGQRGLNIEPAAKPFLNAMLVGVYDKHAWFGRPGEEGGLAIPLQNFAGGLEIRLADGETEASSSR